MKLTYWLPLLLLGSRLPAAETITSAAALAFPSVQESGSARSLGMGSTYVGVAEGSATLPWNPAGLVNLKGMEAALHHNSTLTGSFQETLMWATPLSRKMGLGVSLNYADGGSFEGRDEDGNQVGDYSARTYGASVGLGMKMTSDLAFGGSMKVNRQDLAGTGYNAFAVDLGALWSPSPRLTVGAAYTNLGPNVADRWLASGFSLGLSSYLYKGSDFQWLFSASGEGIAGSDNSLRFGVEHLFYQQYALRGGYSIHAAGPDVGLPSWTLGAGAKLDDLALDYAFIPLAEIGSVHRLSLTYIFGN